MMIGRRKPVLISAIRYFAPRRRRIGLSALVLALMRAQADSKWKRSAAFAELAGFILLAWAGAAFAQGMDATDRRDKVDINREGAESRIERLHADQRRHQQEKLNLKSRKTPKKPQQLLQY
jgi:hypothetical protein